MEEKLHSWFEEKQSAYLYRIIASKESGSRQLMFSQLAQAAEDQAKIWQLAITDANGKLPANYKPNFRARLVANLIRLFGPRPLHSILAAMKVRGMSVYTTAELGHPKPITLEDIGRQHKKIGAGGNLRAAVFGINDGLVSNASLILGMAGAAADYKVIMLAGVAGLLAGAFSMAAGEFVSVRSQREMFEYQIALEKKELELYPDEECEELSLIYQARGLSKADAEQLAATIISNPANALNVLAREELGLNPDELGSPWGAASSSFFSFTIGALIPLLPFLLGNFQHNFLIAVLLTASALYVVGAAISLFTGRNAWLGGLRMLLIGGGAGCITYFIGKILGIALS